MFIAGVGLCGREDAIDLFVGTSRRSLRWKPASRTAGCRHVIQNLGVLHRCAFLINAGTLLSFAILPTLNHKMRAEAWPWCLPWAISVGTLLEYRIWFK
jgi:hypothetical protein